MTSAGNARTSPSERALSVRGSASALDRILDPDRSSISSRLGLDGASIDDGAVRGRDRSDRISGSINGDRTFVSQRACPSLDGSRPP